MAKQKIVWTALPFGRVTEGPLAGRLRVSIVVSPRLTPVTAAEQKLGAPGFADFQDWPKTLSAARFQLRVGAVGVPLDRISQVQPGLWQQFFPPETPVAGFVFKDMSRVNLRSYAVRNVLGFVRKHYGNLATHTASDHPTLLPWKNADGALKGMLGDLGTRVHTTNLGNTSIDQLLPGFDRFFDREQEAIERRLEGQVFSPQSPYGAPVVDLSGKPADKVFPIRVMPADWQDPAQGGPDVALMKNFNTADEYTFYQANRFYHRTPVSDAERRLRRPDLKNVPAAIKEPDFDFHQIVASLADYPQVLRALGLIIDCVLPAKNPVLDALASAASGSIDGVMGLELDWGNGHDKDADAYPRTAWRVSKTRFITAERTADHRSGLLQLAGALDPTITLPKLQANMLELGKRSDFDVFQVDPDGASLKTANYLLTAQNLVGKSFKPGTHGEVAYTTGDRQPVAALRSGGLGVSRHGRAAQVAVTAAAAALKNTAVENSAAESRKIVLFTEDVLRGYRVDVQSQGKWFSLCQRVGSYELIKTHKPLDFGPDEGYVKGASTSGDGSDDHYLHEALFRWTGWSLVAPRPGRTIRQVDASDSGLQGEQVEDVQDRAAKGNGLAVSLRARPGTLPRLRFGQDYRFRARIVDLAGNSLEWDDPSIGALEQATELVSYLRYEPVDPPALVHKHRVSEGESLERLVIRSNFDKSPADYLQTAAFQAATQLPASADFEYVADNQRHVVPAKSAQLQCEHHALFDQAFGSGSPAAIKAAYATAAREAGTLYDPLPGSQIELVTPASVKDVAQTTSVPPKLPSEVPPTGERLVGGQYVLHREDSVQTPYLADGAAGGLSIRGLSRADFARIGITQPMVLGPGAVVVQAPDEELVLLVQYANDWPKTQGLRIVVTERAHSLDDGPCVESFPAGDDGRPKWDEQRRVLTFFLRKGHIARLRYASFIDAKFLDHFGIPRWSSNDSERKFIAGMAAMGLHWMLTPFRPLVLVHATQQPVCTPRLTKVVAARQVGATFADLDAAVQLHGPSTGKVEVVAHWTEWFDDLERPAPQRKDMQARLSEIPLPENGPNNLMLASAAAASPPPAPNGLPGAGNQRALGNRHDFGDTKFRLIKYSLEATTRFREYLPPSLFAQTDKITRHGPDALESLALQGDEHDPGAAVQFNVAGATPNGTRVLSTAAPDVPRIVYTVPTFRWAQDLGADKPTQSSTRLGNSLRVYLERPWFSSGDGELLGVVLINDAKLGNGGEFALIPEELTPYVTQWGLDPLWDAPAPRVAARATDFTARITSETLTLQESAAAGPSAPTVHVVGHRVQWDDDRKLWFADIDIEPGAGYMPFVRLALVRYQPQSLPGQKVSRVALAEFAQLLPRRRAVVQRTGQTVQVSVHGQVPDHGPMDHHNDADHQGEVPAVLLGSVLEAGRNKIELVLQTRDPAIDSDLAWSDVSTLASGLALPPGAKVDVVPGGGLGNLGGLFKEAAVAASTTVNPAALGGITSGTIVEFFDPVVWQATATLPAAGRQPARLVLREFERYYADRTVPHKVGAKVLRKRVVEERLVYSEFFPLT